MTCIHNVVCVIFYNAQILSTKQVSVMTQLTLPSKLGNSTSNKAKQKPSRKKTRKESIQHPTQSMNISTVQSK